MNEAGEVIALEVEDGQAEQLMEFKIVGLCGISEEMTGKAGPITMKMMGIVTGIPLVMSVYTGASRNFISPAVISILGLKVDFNHLMGIKLGDGHRIQTQRKCLGIKMQLGDVEINVEAYIMKLGGIDIILGVVWLETLVKVIMEWRKMSMSFMKEGREVKLCSSIVGQKNGDVGGESDSLHSIIGERLQWVDGLLWTLEGDGSSSSARVDLSRDQQRESNELLNDYPKVFREPNGCLF